MANTPMTEQQERELRQVKAFRPFMLVFGVIRSTGEWETYARPTMAIANRLAREGHTVYILK
jgi:hypothetical protein